MSAANVLRRVGRIVGILLIVLAFSFNVGQTTEGDVKGHTTRTETRVGAWFSPWWRRTTVETVNGIGSAGGTQTTRTTHDDWNLLAGSWLPLLAGIALLVVCRRRDVPPAA